MDPLTALLFSLWIAGYFTRNVYEDAVFKARGEDPPSFRRQQQRWERQQERRDRGPGPARKFMGNAWADAVSSADEKRARRAAKASAARRKKWEEEDQAEEAGREDQKTGREAHDRSDRQDQNSSGSDRWDRRGPGGVDPDDQDARTSGEGSVACAVCGDRVLDSQRRYVTPRGQVDYVVVCPGCAYAEAAEKYREQAEAGQPPASCADCGRTDEPVTHFMGRLRCRGCQLAALDADPKERERAAAPEPEAVEPDPETSTPPFDQGPFEDDDLPDPDDAEVIQFADWQRPAASTTSKEKSMSAEITGLRSAIAFAEGSAASAEAAVSQVELAIANLQTGGTSGPAVAALQAAMEGHQTTASHYRTAAATLTQQLQVAEAYEANKGAGSREFVTSE